MNIQVSLRIKETVNYASVRAKSAEREFERASEEIQRMASSSIDLFGGNAVGEVVDIATKAKMACDKLYAECQSLILLLDGECRPLLENEPSREAVGAVKALIAELNENSKIENNFTASLNGRSPRNVAARRYTPSAEALAIQSFWEGKYDILPKESESNIPPQGERENFLRKVDPREAEAAAEAAANYKQKMDFWNEEIAKVNAKRKETVEMRLEAERSANMKAIEEKYNGDVSEARESIQELKAQKEAAEKRLPQLGFLAFGEKSRCKTTIENCTRAIAEKEEKIRCAEERYASEKEELSYDMAVYREELEHKVEKELPLPPEPPKPQLRISDNYFFNVIYKALKAYGKMTIDDFLHKCPELILPSVARTASFLKIMVNEGVIKRVLVNNKYYYHIS